MAKKLFVGGLPWATTDSDLKDLFSQAGTVASATIIISDSSNSRMMQKLTRQLRLSTAKISMVARSS
jgi:RNA recognition motif-containing protein